MLGWPKTKTTSSKKPYQSTRVVQNTDMCSKLHLQDIGPRVNRKFMLMNDV